MSTQGLGTRPPCADGLGWGRDERDERLSREGTAASGTTEGGAQGSGRGSPNVYGASG